MNTKKLSLLILFFFISLSIASFSILRYKPFAYYINNYNIQPGTYSVSINKTDSSEQILRVSPFDDYIYVNGTKDHPISSKDFSVSRDKTGFLNKFLNGRLLSKTRVSWSMESKTGIKVDYQIENLSPNEFKITRSAENPGSKIDAIGQSVLICSECLITDDKSRVFLTPELLTEEKLKLARSLNFSPVILNRNILPNDVEKITVIDKQKNRKATLYPQGSLEVYYYENWQVLEFKTWLGDQNSVSQTFRLE